MAAGAGWTIWLTALGLYAGFRLWYDGLRRPLAPEEVKAGLARLEAQPDADPARLARVRAFLEADDGREFVMVNLIRLAPHAVAPPDGGAPQPPARVLEAYTRPFLRALLRRAGHPVFVGPAVGGHLESWDVPDDPGWTFTGLIRYRSRRDMLALATHPDFAPIHAYKRAAIASTFAFPAQARLQPGLSPRIWVGLLLALAAALAHLAAG